MTSTKHALRRARARISDDCWYLDAGSLESLCLALHEVPAGDVRELAAALPPVYRPAQLERCLGDMRVQMAAQAATANEVPVVEGVAVVSLAGILVRACSALDALFGFSSLQDFVATLRATVARPDVRAVVLAIDSPGGAVMGTPEAAAAVETLRQQPKPVVSFVAGLGCSAAYYVGSGAQKIYASPSAITGSVGVIAVLPNWTRALAAEGIDVAVLHYGAAKADGSPVIPLAPEARGRLQSRINEMGLTFERAVARHRGVDLARVQADYGQGAAVTASAALAVGMIDGITTLEALLSSLAGSQQAIHRPNPASLESPKMEPNTNAAPLAAEAAPGLGAPPPAPTSNPAARSDALPHPAAAVQPAPPAPVAPGAAAVQQAAIAPSAVPPTDPAAGERLRIRTLEAMAHALGLEPARAAALIDEGRSVEATQAAFCRELAASRAPLDLAHAQEQHSGQPRIGRTTSGGEHFRSDAVAALLAQSAASSLVPQMTADQRALARRHPREIIAQGMALAGARVEGMNAAELFRVCLGAGSPLAASAGSVNHPSSFPNLFAAIRDKLIDNRQEFFAVSYRQWAQMLPAAMDFEPSTMIDIGDFGYLSQQEANAQIAARAKISSETNWIAVDEFSEVFEITLRMWLNDTFNAAVDPQMGLIEAHEARLNRLCTDLLTTNPTLVDGVTLFHSSRGNLVASGGAPSVAQASSVRTLLRKTSTISGQRKKGYRLALALVPSDLETAAQQLFAPAGAPEVAPTAESGANVFRNQVTPVVEMELDAASATAWYGFAPLASSQPIVYRHLQGYEGPQIEDWYEPDPGKRCVKCTGVFAAAVRTWRGAVKNPGA